jgi:hypothetical protein
MAFVTPLKPFFEDRHEQDHELETSLLYGVDAVKTKKFKLQNLI